MNTIAGSIQNYVSFLLKNKKYLDLSCYVSLPLNHKKAIAEEIVITEEKLSTSLAIELKNYYLNDANGTEVKIDKYSISDVRLDIFSHQKILGIYDYFKLYWRYMGTDIDLVNEGCSEEAIQQSDQGNTEYFVCAADWEDNFIETFVFDNEHNFYSFNLDQDEHISYYINQLMNGSDHIRTSKSFAKLLDDSLQEKTEYLKKDIKYNVKGSFFSRLWRR